MIIIIQFASILSEDIDFKDDPRPLPPISVEEPTVRMTVGVNKSPLGGREGKLLQSRVIRDRLFKELEKNVALRVSETDSSDTYEVYKVYQYLRYLIFVIKKVCGRGQLHLTVLIENMRREGFELLVGPPTVIEKQINGVTHEPFELVDISVPNEYASAVIDALNKRKGEMKVYKLTECIFFEVFYFILLLLSSK
jgi:GTP-binding protein